MSFRSQSESTFSDSPEKVSLEISERRLRYNRAHLKRKRSSLILEPLFAHMTDFVRTAVKRQGRQRKKSKRSETLMAEIAGAVKNLVLVGQSIAEDYSEVKAQMCHACSNVEALGATMRNAASDFLSDPCSPSKRQDMVKAADSLLSGVTRMLYIADTADALRLQASLKQVDSQLSTLEVVRSTTDLINSFKRLGNDLLTVTNLTSDIEDMNDPLRSRDLEKACETLRVSGATLKSASEVLASKPGSYDCKEDYYYDILQKVIGATNTISKVLHPDGDNNEDMKGIVNDIISHLLQAGETSNMLSRTPELVRVYRFSDTLDNIDMRLNLASSVLGDLKTKVEVDKDVREVLREAKGLAEKEGVQDHVRTALMQACDTVSDVINNALRRGSSAQDSGFHDDEQERHYILTSIAKEATKDLRKAIMDALVDHVSYKFIGIESFLTPGIILSDGQSKALYDYVDYMKEVSRLTNKLSDDRGTKDKVSSAVKRLSCLRKEVIATSKVLAESKQRQNDCKESWNSNIETLRRASQTVCSDRGNTNSGTPSPDNPNDLTNGDNEDSYWWDNTTDILAAKNHLSSSGELLETSGSVSSGGSHELELIKCMSPTSLVLPDGSQDQSHRARSSTSSSFRNTDSQLASYKFVPGNMRSPAKEDTSDTSSRSNGIFDYQQHKILARTSWALESANRRPCPRDNTKSCRSFNGKSGVERVVEWNFHKVTQRRAVTPQPSHSPSFYDSRSGTQFRTLTPQPPKRSMTFDRRLTPQTCRKNLSEPYSPHPRRRHRSVSQCSGTVCTDLQMALSDMQLNIAPRLEHLLQHPANDGQYPTCCNDANHHVLIDALKMVYSGIQNICSALLDEKQFIVPQFEPSARQTQKTDCNSSELKYNTYLAVSGAQADKTVCNGDSPFKTSMHAHFAEDKR